ncbi:hypothetical protein GCM10009839_33120 [Catenulispora yoronensis]|uniref:TIGR02680 family protein n=1 Tax=Catenulispora yoronensis TaxID=450799 RepID=A0ABP5FSC2_9ACTN
MSHANGTSLPPHPAAHPRFGGRWRLIEAGLSNIWRYGDLDLPAPSGRLLMRGPNGTGKTTALEALWPYLLDLNPAKLAAGKARPTTLKLLMSEGATSKRRYGYLWLTFAPPTAAAGAGPAQRVLSYGARLQYSVTGSPAVKVVPFRVPGRPLADVPLYGDRRSALELDDFTALITDADGQVFDTEDAYVEDLAARIWRTGGTELRLLASRLREVRNPTLLGDVSPQAAASALRSSLPGVSEQVLTAAADALAESEATRKAFDRDREAATVLADFATAWGGHVVDVVRLACTAAAQAEAAVTRRSTEVRGLGRRARDAELEAKSAQGAVEELEEQETTLVDQIRALELSDAYKSVGRIADLDQKLAAEQSAAKADLDALLSSATRAAGDSLRHLRELRDHALAFKEILGSAAAAGADPGTVEAYLSWKEFDRHGHRVGASAAEPGTGVLVNCYMERIDETAMRWTSLAASTATRAASARLVLKDRVEVDRAQTETLDAERAAGTAQEALALHQQSVIQATAAASDLLVQALDAVHRWALAHGDLRQPADSASDRAETDEGWSIEDLTELTELAKLTKLSELTAGEPAQALDRLDEWALFAHRAGERLAVTHEHSARQAGDTAQAQRREAAGLRADALRLRSGQVLPLPRPAWAGPGDDGAAFGTVLEWRSDVMDGQLRARVEVAMAAAGLLGATLATSGVQTPAWQVDASGASTQPSLTEILTVDSEHPHADVAAQVLSRIRLADTAADLPHDPTTLTIGRDGTFRAGVLTGRPAALLTEADGIPPAKHIGARLRQQAAFAEADRLEQVAKELGESADGYEKAAVRHREQASEIRVRAATFPPRETLRKAESHRAAKVSQTPDLETKATELGKRLAEARDRYRTLSGAWTDRVESLGLPPSVEQLNTLISVADGQARELRTAAAQLAGPVAARLRHTLDDLPDEPALAAELAEQAAKASMSQGKAATTKALLEEVRRANTDREDVVRRHKTLTDELTTCRRRIAPARTEQGRTATVHATLQGQLDSASKELDEALPAKHATASRLSTLLRQPAVAEVLAVGPEPPSGEELTKRTETLLAGRRTYSRRHLSERYDQARAALAGTWALARGDAGPGLDELDVFVLTHSEREYTPPAAAARAAHLTDRAEKALAQAEEQALTDFVVGRLPAAIGAAWTRLHDWKSEVNKKMRSAQASSGVGVQVQVDLAPDLSPAARTVYELSCKVGDADRTEQQKTEVGAAIQALLAAADGATMLERLTAAVDIREWVDTHYQVTRPDARTGETTTGRWNSRTGLSGGERRLVVLAPMLAAVAAAYDRLGTTGLRLVPLDEVPAEVDERGREGLARFIAELDLDLLCTSYLWDGAPGAWDGIDAHDLEAGPDGTVVAFPMLIRGSAPIPGDPGPDGTP